jgi:hypothetical protein
MRFSANFSFSFLSSDFNFSVAEVSLEFILVSSAAICLAVSDDCLLLSLVSLASKAAVSLQFSD